MDGCAVRNIKILPYNKTNFELYGNIIVDNRLFCGLEKRKKPGHPDRLYGRMMYASSINAKTWEERYGKTDDGGNTRRHETAE
jgi:hypothetical protein